MCVGEEGEQLYPPRSRIFMLVYSHNFIVYIFYFVLLYTFIEKRYTFSIQQNVLQIFFFFLEDHKNNRFWSHWLLVFQNTNLNISIVLCYPQTLFSAAKEEKE